MLWWIHWLIILVYVLLPAVVLLQMLRSRRTSRRSMVDPTGFVVTIVLGAIISIVGVLVYAQALSGSASISQIVITCWFVISLLLILKLIDRLLVRITCSFVRHRNSDSAPRLRPLAMSASFMMRIIVVFTCGMVLVTASLLVYRPRIQSSQTPENIGFVYQSVSFNTEDGVRLSGWWIPAQSAQLSNVQDSRRTVIVCHGFGSSARSALPLAQQLVPYGYNVLMFDLRAHGDSTGQFSTFGILEKNDVLAAIRWLRSVHPNASQFLYGAGIDLGAAALINAAADPGEAGQSIRALALYCPYPSADSLLNATTTQKLPNLAKWVMSNLVMPMASATCGTDLSYLTPVEQITNIWPRPVMVIHGLRDELIPFELGQELFDNAARPKERLWLLRDDHRQTIHDSDAGAQMRQFFKIAHPVPFV